MAIRNMSHITKEVIKYVNWIINRIYKIKAADIQSFGTDFSGTTDLAKRESKYITENWQKSKIANKAVINGVPVGLSLLNQNYLKNLKQYKVTFERNIPIFASNSVLGGKRAATTTIYTVNVYNNLTTIDIQAPEGYDGNASFVSIGVPKKFAEAPVGTLTAKAIEFMDSATSGDNYSIKRLFDYWGDKVTDGNFDISVSKYKNGVTITLDSNGVDTSSFSDDYDPEILVKVDFYRWGLR